MKVRLLLLLHILKVGAMGPGCVLYIYRSLQALKIRKSTVLMHSRIASHRLVLHRVTSFDRSLMGFAPSEYMVRQGCNVTQS